MDSDVDAKVASIDCRSDRVDEERHVVVDHFHKRICRRVAVLLFIGIENSHERLSGPPHSTKLELLKRDARHDSRRAPLKILERDVRKVLSEVPLDV